MIKQLLIKLGFMKEPTVETVMAPMASIKSKLELIKKSREEAIKKRGELRLALMRADKVDSEEILLSDAQVELMDKMIAKRMKSDTVRFPDAPREG